MKNQHNFPNHRRFVAVIYLLSLSLLTACGGADGPAIDAQPQSISFAAAPDLNLSETVTVSANASSGLTVSYSSLTPEVCSVDSNSGRVTALSPDTCIIAANQFGNENLAPAPQQTQSLPVFFDPNQTISFAAAPELSLFSTASVSATANSGLAVNYTSITPDVCSVNSDSGLVTALAVDSCIIAANQAGNDNYLPAPEVTQSINISLPAGITPPGTPTDISATAGVSPSTVKISFTATDSGGSPITAYTVQSSPAGISGTGSESPVTVICPSSCAGYAFSVTTSNAVGDSAPSAVTDVITRYQVVETFFEPLTQPKNTLFIGTFTFNATNRTVSDLKGILSESMTGDSIAFPDDNMNWLTLENQLSSVYDPVLDGLLVSTFLNPVTDTFFIFDGSDGWSPGTGFGLYSGFDFSNPAPNLNNAYAMIFVNPSDPTAALTQYQINKLAYADCAPGGMMGSTCMTGTTEAGYGVLGTMDGYPTSQLITRLP